MKFVVLIYNDPELLGVVPKEEFNSTMRDCLAHADEMRRDGKLLETQMLEDPKTARSVRIRKGRRVVVDGPFAETKEVLGGFNIIEAANMEEAVKLADACPGASTGCVEIRPVRDIGGVRKAVEA